MAAQTRPLLSGSHANAEPESRPETSLDKDRLLDLLPGFVAYFDRDLVLRYANKPYADLQGIDRQAMVGMACRDIVGAANYAAMAKHLRRAQAGEHTVFEYDVLSHGRKMRVQAELSPDLGDDGSVCGIVAMSTDLTPRLDLQARVADSEALFNDAFANSLLGMAIVDTSGRIMRANRSFADMLGRSEAEFRDMSFRTVTHPEDVDVDMALFQEVLAGNRDGYKLDKRYIHKNGSVIEALLSVSAMRNAAGEIVRFVSQVLDISEHRQAERSLSETNARLSLAMEVVRGGFWSYDVDSNAFETSDHLARYIAGPDAAPMNSDEYLAHIAEQDRPAADLKLVVDNNVERNTIEYRLSTVDGVRWMRCDRQLLRNASGAPSRMVGVVIDITEEREQLEQSEQQADTDLLTGLLNRRGLQRRFKQQAQQGSCSLLMIDLDGFKGINDTLGHHAGDRVLAEVAARLRANVRESDLVARLGGDEFVIALSGADETQTKAIAANLNTVVRRAVPLGEKPVQIGCSIGISWTPQWPAGLDALLARADQLLYDAKAAGKDTWRFICA